MRVQACTEIFTRTSKGGMQPASGGNERRRRGQVKIAREVSRFGQVGWAKFHNLRKPREPNPLSRVSILGYDT